MSILHGFRHFEKNCASYREVYKHALAKLDVEYRRLMRMVVGQIGCHHGTISCMDGTTHDAAGLRWVENLGLVLHLHRNRSEICSLCCPSRAACGHAVHFRSSRFTSLHFTSLHLSYLILSYFILFYLIFSYLHLLQFTLLHFTPLDRKQSRTDFFTEATS